VQQSRALLAALLVNCRLLAVLFPVLLAFDYSYLPVLLPLWCSHGETHGRKNMPWQDVTMRRKLCAIFVCSRDGPPVSLVL